MNKDGEVKGMLMNDYRNSKGDKKTPGKSEKLSITVELIFSDAICKKSH